jgi:hypothetical protein
MDFAIAGECASFVLTWQAKNEIKIRTSDLIAPERPLFAVWESATRDAPSQALIGLC